jgi:hypothetical protein
MAKTRFKCKESRALTRAVRKAGGTVSRTTNGHWRITGPQGHAVVCSKFDSPRSVANAVAQVRRHSGLEIQI